MYLRIVTAAHAGCVQTMAAVISSALMAEKRALNTCCPGTLIIHFSVFSMTWQEHDMFFHHPYLPSTISFRAPPATHCKAESD